MTPSEGCAVAAPASPASTSRPSAGHIALVGVVFFAALTASCLLLGRYLPFPVVPTVREKIEQLARYGDEYDVLFVGSSRVYYQVMPAIFDRIAGERGYPVRSFNAGVGAMVPPEDGYYLDRVLRLPHRRLRWVFLEIMPLRGKTDPILAGTGRFTYWRDWERTRLLTARFLQEWTDARHSAKEGGARWPEEMHDLDRPLGVWLENVGLFVANCSNLGRGEVLLSREFGLTREKNISLERGLSWNGWAFPSIPKPMTENEKRRTDYERAYAALLATEQRFDAGDAVSWEALRNKITRLTDAGITPILIIPPTVAPKRYFPSQLAGQSLAVLDFSDPRKYPEFFTVDHRLDGTHLNAAGAKIYTEALAGKFVEIMEKTGKVP